MEKEGLKTPQPPDGRPNETTSVRQKLAQRGVIKHKVTISNETPSSSPQFHTNSPLTTPETPKYSYIPRTPQLLQNPYFSLHGVTPKVQIPYKTNPGQIPRKLEIERQRRENLKLNLELILSQKGIESEMLVPRQQKKSDDKTTSTFLPLEAFDNEDFDNRTPEDWLALGEIAGSSSRNPIPAKAFLPIDDDYSAGSQLTYDWQLAGVLDYCPEKCQYLVQKVFTTDQEMDDEEHPLVMKENKKKTVVTLVGGGMYWVPRIRLLFCAEDPRMFANRIEFALNTRKEAEAQYLYTVSVKNMPVWQGMPSISAESLKRIKKFVLSTPDPKLKQMDASGDSLNEVRKEYDYVMNSMIFDKVVTNNRLEFSHITLPTKKSEHVPQKGCIAVPVYNYKKKREEFAFQFLQKLPEVIRVLSELQQECSKVANMRLFRITATKPLQLNEFEQTQSQSYSQTRLYLQEEWTVIVSKNIRSTLCVLGKGAYNVNEHRIDIYRLSNLYKLMNVVLFNMQDSLRYLVLDSLINLTDYVLEACECVMQCEPDFVWGDDLTVSNYKPKKNPLFQVDLILDETGVHYNNQPEDFKACVIKVFDEGIQSTSQVSKLDKLVLHNLFIHGDHLLESVGLREPQVNALRDKISEALDQAAVPLKAYAAEYKKHLGLFNLDTKTFLQSNSPDQTSHEVKKEVQRHLAEKDDLESSLPVSIVIGPFYIRVESVRTTLTNKKQSLANALLDRLAQRLRNQIEDACEECNVINRKLREKPNTIEELTEKREWMKSIPKQLKNYKIQLGKTLSDYDVIESLLYCVSDDDASTKWAAIGWPLKLFHQMETVSVEHEEDEKRFRKQQLSDDKKFDETLEFLQNVLLSFAGHVNTDHAHEIAIKVSRTSKQLQECRVMAQTYNTRQNLLDLPVLTYKNLQKLLKEFQPIKDLWIATSDWLRWNEYCLTDPLSSIDPEQLVNKMDDAQKMIVKCIEQYPELPEIQLVATAVIKKIEDFQPCVHLTQCLRNPKMRRRHWEMISSHVGKPVHPKGNMKLTYFLDIGLLNYLTELSELVDLSVKEYVVEQAIQNIEEEWEHVLLELMPYEDSETFILKSPETAIQLLDDHVLSLQSLFISPYNRSFQEQIDSWDKNLRMTRDVLEEWMICQRYWLYMEPILSSENIHLHLPMEAKTYRIMELQWKNIMRMAVDNQKVIELCTDAGLQRIIKQCHSLAEKIQKGLTVYLIKKRDSFPRLFFLSDDDLLEILSKTKAPTAVQPYINKCFENIAKLKFQGNKMITHVYSTAGEIVALHPPVRPTAVVEEWLKNLDASMKSTLKENIGSSLKAYPNEPLTSWILAWPGQVAIVCSQVIWTLQVTQGLERGELAKRLSPQLEAQLKDLVELTRKKLTKVQQMVLSALIVTENHSRSVVSKLVERDVSSVTDFEWISQIRYYWTKGDLYVRVMDAEFQYGYEYLGNSSRMVVTPATQRYYLTIASALHQRFGVSLVGPKGAGKTETVKSLGKATAIQTVVFNCSDRLDFLAVSRFLQGLASTGAWACYNDFYRIKPEVLSVMAQQIQAIQLALQQNVERFEFQGMEISLLPSCAIFFTFSSHAKMRYKELPCNLKNLFRPVAMTLPDYITITEIYLQSYGFQNAKALAKKITLTFSCSAELLSSQVHYDFGMRCMMAVLADSNIMRRENPDVSEEAICVQAIRDMNERKFVNDDLHLFQSLLSDLFPESTAEAIDYAVLEQALRETCETQNLKDLDGFISKCVQLYETIQVRNGLMLVGPAGSGKTQCIRTLAAAMTALASKSNVKKGLYETVLIHPINSKAVTVGQLFGEYGSTNRKWADGILPKLVREGASAMDKKFRWYILDGPVDSSWIDNMSTVLDDNKKLCLCSGEVINLTGRMSVMLEVHELEGATPAVVSRCGMIYFDTDILEIPAFIECWLREIPDFMKVYESELSHLFNTFALDAIAFVRSSITEIISTVDSNLISSLCRLMDSFFSSYVKEEGDGPTPQKKLEIIHMLIEPWFFFSLVWSIGVTANASGRYVFSAWLRKKMKKEKIRLCFPEEGIVHDYRLDYEKIKWVDWMKNVQKTIYPPETKFSDIIVPTYESVTISYLTELLLTNKKHVLCVGPPGIGKSVSLYHTLKRNMPGDLVTHTMVFSPLATPDLVQDFVESKLVKRWKSVLGPAMRKHFIFFIDNLDVPIFHAGCHPPIELLRQWMDYGGWYSKEKIGTFNQLEDIYFASAKGVSRGSKTHVSRRFTRHFNILGFNETDASGKLKIFSAILENWIDPESEMGVAVSQLIEGTVQIYIALSLMFPPSPNKPHYTFNPTHISRVCQGLMMVKGSALQDTIALIRLWYHENCRVFQDGLMHASEKEWIDSLLQSFIEELGYTFEEILPNGRIFFGDFMDPLGDRKTYEYIEDEDNLLYMVKKYLEDYNITNQPKFTLVLFVNALEHVCRICRILRQPRGHALLLGVGGRSSHTLTKLAIYISECEAFMVKHLIHYDDSKWIEDIKALLFKAGLQNHATTFLFLDTQIHNDSYLDDITRILDCGDFSYLYGSEDRERIFRAMRPVVQSLNQKQTINNFFAAYNKRIYRNIHLVICMSPLNERLLRLLRQFPSLVKCCTINWLSDWPLEALVSVSTDFLKERPELELSPVMLKSMSMICVNIYQSVVAKSKQYVGELSRYTYITLKSLLALLTTYTTLTENQKEELCSTRDQLQTAIEKLHVSIIDKRKELDTSPKNVRAKIDMHKIATQFESEGERLGKKLRTIEQKLLNLHGDMIICAGIVTYIGPFIESYRTALKNEWIGYLDELDIPHSNEPGLANNLGDPIQLYSWQMFGLPGDPLSIENSLIAKHTFRWVLFVDPQELANRWIRKKEREKELCVVRLCDQDLVHRLKNAISVGKPCLLENIGEDIDPGLESLLSKQTYLQRNNTVMKLGDSLILFHEDFHMYITTKLPNPHYSLKIYNNITLINFSLSPSGLESLMLTTVVNEELPDMEENKSHLLPVKESIQREREEIEEHILLQLRFAKGNLIDDEDFMKALEESKAIFDDIKAKEMALEKTERSIEASHKEYMPVAIRSRIIFCAMSVLPNVDPMYQYSLNRFVETFRNELTSAEPSENVEERVSNIIKFVTFSMFKRVCQGLFEKHKLMFAFVLCAHIMLNENEIEREEWDFLISGAEPVRILPNPAKKWLSDKSWQDILGLSTLKNFASMPESFTQLKLSFKNLFDSVEPHKRPFPGSWEAKLDPFQKMLILRCVRPDSLVHALPDFVSANLGPQFIEPQMPDLPIIFKESTRVTPFIVLLSPDFDPTPELNRFAETMQFTKRLCVISMGEGQGVQAEFAIQGAMERGHWVFLQNCHLAFDWMPTLEKIIERIDPVKVHKDFRIWLTSISSPQFPIFILHHGFKITFESPKGIKANMHKIYMNLPNNYIGSSSKKERSLLLSLCFFHAIVLERRRFGALGFNNFYEFGDSDLSICMDQLKMFMEKYELVPYKALRYTAGDLIYGGHVTDDWDRRCLLTLLEDFYSPSVLSAEHVYSPSGIYHQLESSTDLKGYMTYIQSLPSHDSPEIYGFHENADIGVGQEEISCLLDAVACLHPKVSTVVYLTLEEKLEEVAKVLFPKIPKPFNAKEVSKMYPIMYEDTMNTVLNNEVGRYNKLLLVIAQSINDINQHLMGPLTMSPDVEQMCQSLVNYTVPENWKAKSYISHRPLGAWVSNLVERVTFLQEWIDQGTPPVFWLSGFFFPQSLTSAVLQNHARRFWTSIDKVGLDFEAIPQPASEIVAQPDSGCYIHGLFLEGARWDTKAGHLVESRPRELFTEMAVIWMNPSIDHTPKTTGIYTCPIYKTRRREGTVTNTGHSINYVFAVDLPTEYSQKHWIKRGVALLCSIDD